MGRSDFKTKTSRQVAKTNLAKRPSKDANAVDSVRSTKKARVVTFEPSQELDTTQHGAHSLSRKKKKVAIQEPILVSGVEATTPKIKKGKERAIDSEALPQHPTRFKVVAGSYEKLLYGLEGSFIGEDGNPLKQPALKPVFIFPAHVSCVKAVGTSPEGGKWLVTGSTDEIIKVWDLRRRKEVGGLIQHEGSITHLSFATRSHLFSASEDGTICIFHARDWSLLRTLKGHKGRVNCVAVHPSMKVALSVGKDRTLRMWDLMRGKGSGSTKFAKECELVRWSTKGDMFVVQEGQALNIFTIDMKPLYTMSHPSRIQDVRFFMDINGAEYLLVAAEDKKVTFYRMDPSHEPGSQVNPPIVLEAVGHENRVKAIDILAVATPSGPHPWTTIMSTVSSDGWIRLFDIGRLSERISAAIEGTIPKIESIASYDTKGTRLTCCALADGEAVVSKTLGKRKTGLTDADASEDESPEGASIEMTGDKDEDSQAQETDEDKSEVENDANE